MLRCTSILALVLSCLAFAIPVAFSQAVSFTTSSSPYLDSLHADFNSDGREDFINSTGCSNSSFGLALSTGDGTYDPPVCYALPNSAPAYYFAIGDFNGDGNADVIITNNSNTVYEYLGSRSGKLRFYRSFTAPTAVTTLAAADVNHDGNIDLLFNGGDNNLWVWFGNGDGTFTPGPATPIAGGGGWLLVGDFDGDGKADILSENPSEGGTAYQVFYGDGTGHFQASKDWVDDVDYAVYDLNGDGRSDLVGQPFDFSINGNTYYNKVRVLYGNANRIFREREITTGNCDAWAFAPAIADLNGDGINDIAAVEASDCQGDAPDTFNVLLGKPNGTYQQEQVIYTGSASKTLSGTSVLRADQDSKPDLVLSEVNGGTANLLFQNTTTGNFPACNPPNAYTGTTLCAPTTTVVSSSPVQFSIGAANQTPGRKVEVWVDGKKMSEQLKGAFSYYSFLDATYKLPNGKHTVTVFSAGWDNLLQELTFPLTVGSTTCDAPSAPGVNVCSPLNRATVNSPVLAWASGTVTGTVARMEVWVDGVKKYTTYKKNSLKTNISLDSGTHRLVYYIVNTAGQKRQQTVYATVP